MTPREFREFVAITLDVDLNDVEKVWEALRRRDLIGSDKHEADVRTADAAQLLSGLCIAMTGSSGNISAESAIYHVQLVLEAWANKKPYRYLSRAFEAPLSVEVRINASPLAKIFTVTAP
jgi:hypothetical protein